MAGRITLFQRCRRVSWKFVAISRRSFGMALAPAMTLKRIVPLSPEHHEQDRPDVERNVQGDEHDRDEGEQQVSPGSSQDLHDRLGVAGEPAVQPDPYADRYPDERRDHDEDRHPTEGGRGEGDEVGEPGETDSLVK